LSAEAGPAPWASEPGGLVLFLRLTPKGGRDALDGIETLSDGRKVVKGRVRAAPENGAANAALIAMLAKTVGVAKSAVTLASGETSRVKKLRIAGDPARLAAALASLLAQEPE
jgi:uncharacterized protein (TIGR00251 family)